MTRHTADALNHLRAWHTTPLPIERAAHLAAAARLDPLAVRETSTGIVPAWWTIARLGGAA